MEFEGPPTLSFWWKLYMSIVCVACKHNPIDISGQEEEIEEQHVIDLDKEADLHRGCNQPE